MPVPPGVVTLIRPVCAPVGTVAVIWVSEFTVKVVALTPPNVTLVAPVRLLPVIVTTVPTLPLVGENFETTGVTRNTALLTSIPVGTITRTVPVVVAPIGTVIVICDGDMTVKIADAPLMVTLVASIRSVPKMLIAAPTLPNAGSVSTNGLSPTERLNSVPSPLAPP